MKYFNITTFIFFTFFNSLIFAQTIYIHSPTLSEENFSSLVFQLRGITLVDYLSKKYSFRKEIDTTTATDVESIQRIIQEIESAPILRAEAEVLMGLYRKLDLLDEKSVPLSRVAGLFTAHPELQDYYFDYWNKIKNQIKISKISEQNKKDLFDLINTKKYLLVDGKLMDLEKINSLTTLPHQWVLFSNTSFPLIYTGTASGLLNRSQEQTEAPNFCFHEASPFLKAPQFKITILNQENHCHELIQKNPLNAIKTKEKSFYEQNKNWLVPTGFVLGFFAISSLKDKKVTIKLPALSF